MAELKLPLRLSEENPGIMLDADGQNALWVDGDRDNDEAAGIAEWVVNSLNASAALLAEVKEYRRTVAYYLDVEKGGGDDEGQRLKQIKINLLDALIAKVEAS